MLFYFYFKEVLWLLLVKQKLLVIAVAYKLNKKHPTHSSIKENFVI